MSSGGGGAPAAGLQALPAPLIQIGVQLAVAGAQELPQAYRAPSSAISSGATGRTACGFLANSFR